MCVSTTVSHTLLDQSSILRFIEDNWHLGQIGNQFFDVLASSISAMFDFNGTRHPTGKLFLDPSNGMHNTTG
jgi:phospholipase C